MIKHLAIKDKKKRSTYTQCEDELRQLKAIATNMLFPAELRFKARLKITELPRNSSVTRIRNRCIITGRPRGVYRFCKLSRIKIRELIAHNKLPGLRKSSW